jgi:vacuolar iron transporter family protein
LPSNFCIFEIHPARKVEHHHHDHKEQHFTQSEVVRDIVIGMADGLTVPFALAAGLSAIPEAANSIIIAAGIAEISAGSIAMGLGGYLAGKTEVDHFNSELKREYHEVKHHREVERKEVMDILGEYGVTPGVQKQVMDDMEKNEDKWVDFMMRFELGLEKPDERRASKSALNIGLSYIVGGIIPLLGYVFTDTPESGLVISSIITIACLLIFGYFKSKATGQAPVIGALKTTAIGILAAGAAFIIASFFGEH